VKIVKLIKYFNMQKGHNTRNDVSFFLTKQTKIIFKVQPSASSSTEESVRSGQEAGRSGTAFGSQKLTYALPNEYVEILARQLYHDEAMIVHLVDEWRIYQTEDGLAEEYEIIDHYWRSILKIKYKCLPDLMKTALVLQHGNADVERSLSVNTSVVTADRPAIGERTICAIRTVKDTVKVHDPISHQPLK
jgi:hypothetical protein